MQYFSYFWIRFTAVLLSIENVNSVNSLSSANAYSTYYTCDNVIFSSEAVDEAVIAGSQSLADSQKYPLTYQGSLYDGQETLEMFPIMEDGHIFDVFKETQDYGYFIIFKTFDTAVGVIEKIPQHQDRICSVKRAAPTFSSSSYNNYKSTHTSNKHMGFICGQKIFSLQLILEAKSLARFSTKNQNKDSFMTYTSPLCPYFKCLLLPLNVVKDKAVSGGGGLSYHLIIDQNFSLRGMVSRSSIDILGQCTFVLDSRNGMPSVKVKQHNPADLGYQCGFDFFPNDYLISEVQRSIIFLTRIVESKYPMEYTGPSFTTNVLLWPVFPKEKSYEKGWPVKWFLVMTTKLEIICVAIITESDYVCCGHRMADNETFGEMDEFNCLQILFISREKSEYARREACGNKDRIIRKKYPAMYIGPDFDVPGPYIIWPLVNGGYKAHPGRLRIVINAGCQLAGVLIKDNYKFLKCQREKERTTPGGISNRQIYEISMAGSSAPNKKPSGTKRKLSQST